MVVFLFNSERYRENKQIKWLFDGGNEPFRIGEEML
jgi:hypothetical protein